MKDVLWTVLEIDIVRRLAERKCSPKDIAMALPKRTRNAVIGLCHRRKIELKRNKANPISIDEAGKIVIMVEEGKSITQIAYLIGRSYPAVGEYLRKTFGGIRRMQWIMNK